MYPVNSLLRGVPHSLNHHRNNHCTYEPSTYGAWDARGTTGPAHSGSGVALARPWRPEMAAERGTLHMHAITPDLC